MASEIRVPNRKLTTLSMAIATTQKPTLINAAFNKIADLRDIKKLYDSLQFLILTNNPLTSIQHIQYFPNLKYLSISKTQVSDLSPLTKYCLHSLKLEELWAQHTQLSDFDAVLEVLATLPFLDTLILWPNPLHLNLNQELYESSITSVCAALTVLDSKQISRVDPSITSRMEYSSGQVAYLKRDDGSADCYWPRSDTPAITVYRGDDQSLLIEVHYEDGSLAGIIDRDGYGYLNYPSKKVCYVNEKLTGGALYDRHGTVLEKWIDPCVEFKLCDEFKCSAIGRDFTITFVSVT